MNLPLDSIMKWDNGITVINPSDHSRSELSVGINRIGSSERMANGRLRSYHVADKKTWSCSWDLLPAPSEYTADGKAGGKEMEQFYNNTKGEFQLTITNKDSSLDQTYDVMFVEFNKSIAKRGAYDMWNVSVTIEEC